MGDPVRWFEFVELIKAQFERLQVGEAQEQRGLGVREFKSFPNDRKSRLSWKSI